MDNDRETTVDIEEVISEVVGEHDMNDVASKRAVDEFLKTLQGTRSVSNSAECLHSFRSAEVIESIKDYIRADIDENIAIVRAHIAKIKRTNAMRNVQTAAAIHEGVFINEEAGEQLVPALGGVYRMRPGDRMKLIDELVQASVCLATDNGEGVDAQPSTPSNMSGEFTEYISDLADFISANGDAGREAVVRICEDAEYAKSIYSDEDMPRPVRFLSSLVLSRNGSKSSLPAQQKRRIGFGTQER